MSYSPDQIGTSTAPIPARLAALKTMPTPRLKEEWRTLFGTEPPAFNRQYLISLHSTIALRRVEA